VRNVRRAVKKLANSMATVGSNNTAVLLLGVLLDNVAELSDQCTGLHSLDGLVQALSRCFNHANSIRISLGLVTNIVGLVQIGVVSLVVQRNINVEDIAVEENTLVWNAVTDYFVNGCTTRLGKVVVVQRRWIRLYYDQYSRGDTNSWNQRQVFQNTYVSLNAGLVNDLVDVVGGYARLGSGSSNVEYLSRKSAALSHSILARLVENFDLVTVGERAAIPRVAVLPPHGVGDRLRQGSVRR
jgi:hypothetical protein